MAKNLLTNWEASPYSDSDLDKMDFPLLCPRCLKKTDLTDYTVKVGNKNRNKKVTMPICQPCKKASIWRLRKQMLVLFAVWGPVSVGLFIVLVKTGIMGKTIEALGFPWGFILPGTLILTPLYTLWLLISCFIPPIRGLWPIDLKEQLWTLLFENETYVREFTKANVQRLRSVTNEAVIPPVELMKDGRLLF